MNDRVLIVGSVALDDIKTPWAGEKNLLGGSAVYGSMAASQFAGVDIVGVIGDDFPQEHLDLLSRAGVNIDGVERQKGKTFHWGGEYHENMNDRTTHFTELGVFAEFDPKIPASYREDGFVFLANIDPELQLRVLGQVKKPRLTLLDTMNLWINIKRAELVEIIKRVDAILINEDEARLLFPSPSQAESAEKLLELGVSRVIIKKGSNGAQMFSKQGTFAVPALPLKDVKDPTGAGDTFAGGLVGYLAGCGRCAEGSSPEDIEMAFRQAMIVGSACASYVVEDFSTRRINNITKEKIQQRCDQLYASISCDPVVIK
ncbi:PfkB family carbohydrate kinase [bacterium]|nr:PfkB family carbohydrate kinase [bacterium]